MSANGLAWFEMAPSIRDFAFEELAASGEAAEMESRWIGWLAARARAAGIGIRAPEPNGWWVWLEGAHGSLRNALPDCLASRRIDAALDLLTGLAPYWDARALHSADTRLLDRAIEMAEELEVRSAALTEALLWFGLLGIRGLMPDTPDRYADRLEQGEKRACELADDRLIMLAAHCRAQAAVMTGDIERGLPASAQGLDIARRRTSRAGSAASSCTPPAGRNSMATTSEL